MGPKRGGTALTDRLDELEEAVDQYYGMLNLIRMGIKPKPNEVYEKPEVMTLVELCADLNMPRVTGGLEEQPYIWLLEQSIVKNRVQLQEQLFKSSQDKQSNVMGAS